MPKLIIMRGLSGSGKSTWAREMRGAAVWSADYYFGTEKNSYLRNFDVSKIPVAHEWCKKQVEYTMEDGHPTIILDNCNAVKIFIQPYLELAKQYGYDVQYQEPTSPIWADVRSYLNGERLSRSDVKALCAALSKNTQETHCVPAHTILHMLYNWEEV